MLTKTYKQTKLNNYWLSQPMPTSNIANLSDEYQQENTDQIERKTKPPPIFVNKVGNI